MRRLTQENEQLRTDLEALKRDHKTVLEAIVSQSALLKKERLEHELRCEALTAERDQLQQERDMGCEAAAKWREDLASAIVEMNDLRSRYQRLEQAIRDVFVAGINVAKSLGDNLVHLEGDQVERQFQRTLASLLPTQEEPTQTDENRVSFAAGYSQGLDDQAKGLK
jgi:DNA repair exonuclease SbcCD ATPase subunit